MSRSEIIIAAGNAEAGNKIRQVLIDNGYTVTGICSSGNEAIRKVRTLKPALLLANFELPDMTGFEVAKIIAGNDLCSVILLADDTQKGYVESRARDLDIVCLNRPVNRALLLNSVELTIRSRMRIEKLEKELNDMKNNLETRKEVDKAKGLLMEKSGLSEQEAYRRLQKQSMDTGISMKEVAKIIIDTMK
ncbi:MAG TPA: ANTAR domain-containing protein [Clostridia bacterium]|nr:ANTAR domain-containing protein [Clostridia bacterium]